MILFVAIGGLLALMGYIVLFASQDNVHLELVEVSLHEIEVLEIDSVDNKAELQVAFLVKNPGEKTFTVPLISYELFANGKSLGTGQYSTEDVAMPGRAAFYGGAEIPLKNKFNMVMTDVNAQEYQAIINGEQVSFSAKGMITAETAWSLIEKDFETSM